MFDKDKLLSTIDNIKKKIKKKKRTTNPRDQIKKNICPSGLLDVQVALKSNSIVMDFFQKSCKIYFQMIYVFTWRGWTWKLKFDKIYLVIRTTRKQIMKCKIHVIDISISIPYFHFFSWLSIAHEPYLLHLSILGVLISQRITKYCYCYGLFTFFYLN